jgi:hypothetical protein
VLTAHVSEEGHARDLYVLHIPTLGHTYTHMLGTHACMFPTVDDAPVGFIRRNPSSGDLGVRRAGFRYWAGFRHYHTPASEKHGIFEQLLQNI